MQEWFIHPVVQGAIMPFLAGLIASALLAPLRLGGLAAVAGFATAVYLVVGFEFSPMTTIRKVMLLGLIAPMIGVAADFAFKPTRYTAPLLALSCGAVSIWVFLALLQQRELAQAVLLGGGVAAYVAWLVGFMVTLRDDSIRAGAASLGLGLGTGVAAVLAASATLGLYAMALGSASGAFLLVQMLAGKRFFAGIAFTLTAGLLAGLLGAASYHLAQLPWHALPVMALLPLAARLPVPAKWPVAGQAVAVSGVTLALAAVSCFLVWQASRGSPG
ncbi:MAG: hypothetical protein EPO29_00540 [Betaproteobacteria bacterium]|nr:MAG: hypothetical protein EPO29_00540 [Betaproteobacteria bacterium]